MIRSLSRLKTLLPAVSKPRIIIFQQRFASAKTDLKAVLAREIVEEEENLADMDEHYEDDLHELRKQFSSVQLNIYDPVIRLEKNSADGEKILVRCNIEDQADDVHYLDISVSNNKNKTIGFRVEIFDSTINVENFRINDTDKLLDETNVHNLYDGPKFTDLEDDLQDGMILFLEERGIDSNFAEIMQNVINVKEQEEYIHFLHELDDFV
eukprot:g5907.t1